MKFGVIIMEKLAQWKYLATEWVIPDTYYVRYPHAMPY